MWGFILESLCIQAPAIAQADGNVTGGEYCAPFIFPELGVDASMTNPEDCEAACESTSCGASKCSDENCKPSCEKLKGCVWRPNAIPEKDGSLYRDTRCAFKYTKQWMNKKCHWCENEANRRRLVFVERVRRAIDAGQTVDTSALDLGSVDENFREFQERCVKVGSDFCLAMLEETLDPNTGEMVIEKACKPELKACFRAVVRKSVSVLGESFCNELPIGKATCLKLVEVMVKVLDVRIRDMCIKNDNQQPKYCGDYSDTLFDSEHDVEHPARKCIKTVATSNVCSAECAKTLGDFFNGAGCCVGTLHSQLRERQKLGDEEVSAFASGLTGVYEACKKTSETDAAKMNPTTEGCKLQKGNLTKTVKVALKLPCTLFTSSASLQTNLRTALTSDIAGSLGLATSFLAGAKIGCDQLVQVTTAGRRFGLLQSESGTSMPVNVKAEDDTSTSTAVNNFNKAAQNGNLDLTRASQIVTKETGQTLTVDQKVTQLSTSSNSTGVKQVGESVPTPQPITSPPTSP
eukprot:Sspe_Gene.33516::Locus_16360_Transcript_1_1_Confidence_1.000_Length_4102::g.33516::m.33516